jgi:hypothetical protein
MTDEGTRETTLALVRGGVGLTDDTIGATTLGSLFILRVVLTDDRTGSTTLGSLFI